MSSPNYFYCPLEVYGDKVPIVVSDLCLALEKLGCQHVEGIFRLNGSDKLVKQLITDINNGTVDDYSKHGDIHTVATVLKRYFRNIAETESIIDYSIGVKLIESISESDVDANIQLFSETLKTMSIQKYRTVAYFLRFLYHLSLFKEETHMTAENLSICITPNILVPPPEITNLSYSLRANNVVTFIIEHFNEIFEGFVFDNSILCKPTDLIMQNDTIFDEFTITNLSERYKQRRNSFVHFVAGPKPRYIELRPPQRDPPQPQIESENNNIILLPTPFSSV